MYQVEVTDTFGGEANYCWVRRYTFKPAKDSRLAIVRGAKALAGWSGVRCSVEYYGDSWTLRPSGMCQIMFINWEDDRESDNESI